MSDSENSQPPEDSDDDIYNNILEFNFEDEFVKLEDKETYKQEVNDLSEKVKTLAEENKELKKSNEVLKKNLSTLLKTAQAEVQRKDSMIEELRNEIESFTFKRNKNITKDKYTSTDDLETNSESKYESEKHKRSGITKDHQDGEKKRSQSYENWTSSDSERKSTKGRQKESLIGDEENMNCDCNNKKSDYSRENSKANSRHSDGCHDTHYDRHREKKSARYEYTSGYRKPYRENHLDHLKYDSYDKKRHSRSSDRRFICRCRNSKERKNDCCRSDSPGKRRIRRSDESCERYKSSRPNRSHFRDVSWGSKQSYLEKPKTRSSLDNDSVAKTKEQVSAKTEIVDKAKNNVDDIESIKRNQNSEKRTRKESEGIEEGKNKQIREKNRFDKKEKRHIPAIFSTKSPLDALYSEMITRRNSNSKSGTDLPESDLEEGEIVIPQTTNDCQGKLKYNALPYESKNQIQEDWTLSFKNERKNETKSMTLYSRRMMRKISTENKNKENVVNKEEKIVKGEGDTDKESVKEKKIEEIEKEPGELTDDENIVESSKEFQELAKVASIESEIIEETIKEETLKETIRVESSKSDNLKTESVLKEGQKEAEKPASGKEESSGSNEAEANKNDVVEFSPFKNNYRLIEISPIKPSGKEHILDFYNRRVPPGQSSEQNAHTVAEEKTDPEKESNQTHEISEEKNSWKNSSSEKDSETELKIIIPSVSESPKKQEMKPEKKEVKELRKKKGKTENKKTNVFEKDVVEEKEKNPNSKKKTRESTAEDKRLKRKRKLSEVEEETCRNKKTKTEKNESSQKSTRSKRNTKSEPENISKSDVEPDVIPGPKLESENKIKDDISSFEFFKPVAKTENPLIPIDADKGVVGTSSDYKMTTMMSVSEVVRLETPNKCLEKLNNLIINEQMIFNVTDSRNSSQFSPLIGSKCVEMTPRRMLKNDLMLTDSEDDSVNKGNGEENTNEVGQEEVEEEEEEDEDELSESENSECDSDSGASDFVDLL